MARSPRASGETRDGVFVHVPPAERKEFFKRLDKVRRKHGRSDGRILFDVFMKYGDVLAGVVAQDLATEAAIWQAKADTLAPIVGPLISKLQSVEYVYTRVATALNKIGAHTEVMRRSAWFNSMPDDSIVADALNGLTRAIDDLRSAVTKELALLLAELRKLTDALADHGR